MSEDIIKESVIYQDIFQKGKQEEKQEEAIRFLTRQLNRRFGEIDSSIIERILLLSTEELEILGEELFNILDVSNLVTWLDNNQRSSKSKHI